MCATSIDFDIRFWICSDDVLFLFHIIKFVFHFQK